MAGSGFFEAQRGPRIQAEGIRLATSLTEDRKIAASPPAIEVASDRSIPTLNPA